MKEGQLNESRLLEMLSKGVFKTSVCRLCLTEQNELFNIHETFINEKLISVYYMLNTLHLMVESDDKYPEVVCASCLKEITNIYNFQMKCQMSIEKYNYLYENIYNNIKNTSSIGEDIKKRKSIFIIVLDEDKTNDVINDRDCLKIKKAINSVKLEFSCKICSEEFESTELFQSHMLANHNVEKYDDFCIAKLFNKKKKTSKKRSFCQYCDKELFKGFHSMNQELKCDLCDQVYPCEGSLESHVQNIHDGHKLSNELSAESYRKIDEEIKVKENGNPLSCNVCSRIYYSIEGLQKHIRTHYNIFTCDYCGIKYTLKENLRRHILIKHMNHRKFFCEMCDKGFFFAQQYNEHKVVHTGEKLYQCDVCGKKFATQKTLVIHNRIHTGEKPYSCILCTDKFISMCRLKDHVQRKHIGKLKCPKCLKEFTRKESITKHLKLQRCVVKGENN